MVVVCVVRVVRSVRKARIVRVVRSVREARVMLTGVPVAVIGAGLGFERLLLRGEFESHAGEHGIEHMIAAVAQPVRAEFERYMPVAEMIGAAGERTGIARARRGHGLACRMNFDDAPVLGEQPVAAAQDLAPRQHDANLFAVLETRAEAAAAADLEWQDEPRARCIGRRASGIGGRGTLQDLEQGGGQKRKYRCASGSSAAGSQVRS